MPTGRRTRYRECLALGLTEVLRLHSLLLFNDPEVADYSWQGFATAAVIGGASGAIGGGALRAGTTAAFKSASVGGASRIFGSTGFGAA